MVFSATKQKGIVLSVLVCVYASMVLKINGFARFEEAGATYSVYMESGMDISHVSIFFMG
jgi:hypothetical protein